MPDQDEAKEAEPDLDQLMARKLAHLKEIFEPDSLDLSHDPMLGAAMSIAISLKRLADNSNVVRMAMAGVNDACFKLPTGLNSLCDVLKQASTLRHDDAVAIKSVLYGLDSTIAHNTGRELRINISKD